MTRKQSEYLASLLAKEDEGTEQEAKDDNGPEDKEQAPSPAPEAGAGNNSTGKNPTSGSAPRRAGVSLLGRESALARVASGEVKQVTQLLLNPDKVRIWSGNARVQAQLNEDNCRELIDSIIAEGGQKVPVVVRRVSDRAAQKAGHDYELIAGTRRHFAISWLRAHSYPDMKLLAQVADLDDEAAFRLADIENRARTDVSDIERARNYAHALTEHYDNHQTRMAERLKISKGWLSKMLKVATLPDDLLACFPNWQELALNPAYRLALTLDDPQKGEIIRDNIPSIQKLLEEKKEKGADFPDVKTIIAMLLEIKGELPPLQKRFKPISFDSKLGRPALSADNANRQGVTLKLHAGSGASEAELTKAFKQILAALKEQGREIS